MNQQLLEFGLGLDRLYDQAAVKQKIGEVDTQFDLVMIAERFDESMVLMAHLLCWDLADLVNLKLNARAKLNKVRSTNMLQKYLTFQFAFFPFSIPSYTWPIIETQSAKSCNSWQIDPGYFYALK